MDIVLEIVDTFFFDRVYAELFPLRPATGNSTYVNQIVELPRAQFLDPTEWAVKSSLPRDNVVREFISLFLIVWIFGFVLYSSVATCSYFLLFDKDTFNHPRFLKNQVRKEITVAMGAMPIMSLLTVPWMLAEIHGYSNLYWGLPKNGWKGLLLEYPAFIMFTDFGVYLIHRGLHHKSVYKTLHKPHHKWIMPTPFASHAFHPLDGYFQSLPYHIYPFLFPLNKLSYLFLFSFVNLWSVTIHDGEFLAAGVIINGAANHTIHHLYFNYNYGQFTTLWDRIGGSYRQPTPEMLDKHTRKSLAVWNKQISEMEKIAEEINHELNAEDFLANERETHDMRTIPAESKKLK
ncbi:hypothetical protein CANCADRAFT_30630 [Tortispora caseinolytica NRRL Y-17796]|uniref:Fatty acid hydroxylase domain-containing protein n=1 Tax=Tortispora caseinolytica NRRL Y-17796 TaxID=767744 RepID=A0A1E4TL63_9ASCO|nr:hypothetical protein CANCADRAFT_30630 [Tortispora caseinolytica NRRL Y-17796]